MPAPVGTWRSLVAYLNGVQGVPGSNPGVPTKQTPTKTNLPKGNPRCFRTFREISRGSHFSSCWLLLVFFRVFIRTQVRTHEWISQAASRTAPAGPAVLPSRLSNELRRFAGSPLAGFAQPGGLRALHLTDGA